MYNFGECHGHIALDGINYSNSKKLHENGPDIDSIRAVFKKYNENNIDFIRDGGDKWGVSKIAGEIALQYDIDYRSPAFAIYKKGHYGKILGREYDTISDFKKLVTEVKKSKGDFIKIMLSGIMDFSEFGKISDEPLSFEEVRSIGAIAHDEGFRVMAHVNGSISVKNAIKAGVDSIEHGYYMDEECIEMLKTTNIVWVPTLTPVYKIGGTENIINSQANNITKAYDNNISLALGSDSGSYLVKHVDGIKTEEKLIKDILGDNEKTNSLLIKGEKTIRDLFKL